MPPLRLFNRSWHISSDDLVLPAWVGVAFHGTWTSLIAAEVIIIGLPDDCVGRQLATSSVLWLLISFALTTLLQCVVAGIAMRGAMLEEYKRAAMPTALYCLLSAYALEAAALVYATIVNFGLLADTIGSCHTAEELARTTISELSLHRWFVGSTWGMLIAICGLLVLMYNLYPDRGLESWEKRVNCMSYILCCRKSLTADADDDGSAAASAPTVVRLARVFGDLFYPLNFSFTDTLAAITLVGITHRSSAHGHGSSSHNHALIAAAGAGVLSAGSKTDTAVPGAGALLEAVVAAAAAAARQANTAAAAGDAAGQLDAVCSPGPTANGGVSCVQGLQQELQLAARAASPVGAAAAVDAPQQRSPSPALKGIKHSSSTGNVQSAAAAAATAVLTRGSSPTPLEPVGVSLPRSASNSAWEAAVRQGSALAVAPGRGVVPGAGIAGGSSSRPTSPAPDAAAALPVRSHSTALDSAAASMQPRGSSPSRFNQRAVSWGGGGAPSTQPILGRSSEQGAAAAGTLVAAPGFVHPHSTLHRPQPAVLSSLAEANELSLAHSNVLGQVESLLSPLASEEAAVEPAAAGAAAAGDAVGSVGGGGAALGVHTNPLFCDTPGQLTQAQAMQQAGYAQQQEQQASQQGGVPGAAVGPLACVTVAGAAAAAAATAAAAAGGDALAEVGAVNAAGQPVGLELLEEALHWHAYANAIYGWPMFLWSHRYRVLRCCRLCCGGCCKGIPEAARSSGGGLGVAPHHMHTPLALSSTDEGGGSKASAAADKAVVGGQGQGSSFGSSSNGTHAGGITTIVTLSSVDTDSVSPGSTSAAGSGEATAAGPCLTQQQQQQQACGPVAEGREETAAAAPAVAAAACAGGDSEAAAGDCWDVEQGGGCAIAAAAASSSPACGSSSIAMRSRRSVQSSGNIWLLQGLADALGISKESAAVVADGGGLSPREPSQGAAGTAAAGSGAAGGGGSGSRQPRLSTGGLRADGGPCGCMCGGKWGENHVPKMAPLTASQRLTNEAIMQTANIPAADLLYVNYNNLVEGLLPYSVVLDAGRRCVVVAIRGSLSVEDCVTDILYDPAPLDEDWLLQQPAAAAPAEPCQPPDHWQQAQEDTVAAAAGDALLQQQQQESQQLDWPPAPALEAALQAAAADAPVPGRSMPGASSGGGSFRSTSMKASPFASAAAAASVAARNSSSGAEALGAAPPRPPPVAAAPPPLPSVPQPQQQQPLQGGLSHTPSVSVPAAQAAAAAAAAAGRPLPAGGRPLRRHWSVNFGALQEQQQQQQVGGKLSEQPSFMRRASASLRQRAQQQQDGDGEQQQQQLVSRPSVLESALSVLLGPWRRLTGSDTGDAWHRQQHRQTDADAAAEEGRTGGNSSRQRGGTAAAAGGSTLGSFRGRVAGGSTEGQEPGSGSGTPRRLFKTLSLNLGTALAGGGGGRGGQQQQQGAAGGRRRMAATTSSRLLGGGREQGGGLLQSYASEHIPSGSSAGSRRTTADSWRTSQTRRTTAADRALGAARAGHRYAPMTCPATDQSAAAAAASHRSFMQQLHQQQQRQQQHQQALSAMPSMRSTAPASIDPSITAAALAAVAAAAGTGAASEPGMGVNAGGGGSTQWPAAAAAAAVEGRASGDAHGSPSGVRSRRSTLTQLPRINSGSGAVGEQQQQQLAMMASVPAALLSKQQQQQDARPRPASDDGGGSVGGASSGQRPSLLSTVSEAAWRSTRRLGLPLPLRPRQQQQQLLDGGPTDWSLLSGAATMVPSRTAAVQHAGGPLPPAAGGGGSGSGSAGLLSKSYSVGFSNSRPGTGAGQVPALLGTSYSARPPAPGTPSGASVDGRSAPSSVAAGSTCEGGTPLASSAAAAAGGATAGELVGDQPVGGVSAGGADNVSPFMQHQQALLLETELGADPFSAAAAHLNVNQALQQQQDGQWVMQPLLDGSGEGESDAAAAALVDEAEAAAAAEADAVAAAAQAAAAEETPDTGAAGDQWFAHEGILNCARAIRDDLDRLGLLDQLLLGPQHPGGSSAADTGAGVGTGASKQQQQAEAEEGRFMRSSELPDCRGWTLMLTGHSLGAGVAAMLALHYRARYGSVRAWCFAPPGGLMSPAAAASLKDICYSLVSAKDMIPRMSLWTIERLRDEMMICALRCKMPKYKLLLGAAFGKKWEEDEVLRPLEQLTQAQVAAFQEYRQEVVEERSLDPLRVRIAREFVPPGEVLWLERNKQLQPRLRVPNTTLTMCPTAASADGAAGAGAAAAAGGPGDQPATLQGAASGSGATAVAACSAHEPSSAATAGLAPAAAPSAAAAGAAAGGGTRDGAFVSSSRGSSSMLRGGSAALEAAAVAVAGKRVVTRLHPHVTDGLGIIVGGMVVSRNMFADHVPDKQLAQLKRLVRYLRRQQALGRALPEGITPVVLAAPPAQQGMPPRTCM